MADVAHSTPVINRRVFLWAGIGAAALSSGPAHAGTTELDRLMLAHTECFALIGAGDDDTERAALDAETAALHKVVAHRPASIAGQRSKARYLLAYEANGVSLDGQFFEGADGNPVSALTALLNSMI